jgi:hypothetical protein
MTELTEVADLYPVAELAGAGVGPPEDSLCDGS